MIGRLIKFVTLIIIISFMAENLPGQGTSSRNRERDRMYNQGIGLVGEGDYVAAGEVFSRCIETDSTFAPAYLQRGRISIEQGLKDEALKDLQMAINYSPGYGEALFYSGYLLFEEDTSGIAMELINQALQNGFNDPYAYYLRGVGFLLDGQPEMALIDFNTAITLKPDFAIAYHDRAGIKRVNGDLQGALLDYKAAIDFKEDFALAYNNIASVKITMGDYEGGIKDYSRAIELDSGLFLAYNNRGCARYQMGEYDAALEDFNLAVLLNESFSLALMNKAAALARKNDYTMAVDLLDKTIEMGTDEALIYLNRGLIRELTGNKTGACSDWQEALDRGYEKAAEYLKECNK